MGSFDKSASAEVFGTRSIKAASEILSSMQCAVNPELQNVRNSGVMFPAAEVLECDCNDATLPQGAKCPSATAVLGLMAAAGSFRPGQKIEFHPTGESCCGMLCVWFSSL